MEFHTLGKHCTQPECKQLDFLPFTCDLCKKVFCLDHREYKQHDCPQIHTRKDAIVPVCPACNQLCVLKKGENAEERLRAHLAAGCPDEARTVIPPKKKKCNFRGCGGGELLPVVCNECHLNFCLKHRFPAAHKCHRIVTARSPQVCAQEVTSTSVPVMVAGRRSNFSFVR